MAVLSFLAAQPLDDHVHRKSLEYVFLLSTARGLLLGSFNILRERLTSDVVIHMLCISPLNLWNIECCDLQLQTRPRRFEMV